MNAPRDDGTVGLWLLGLCVMLLFLGGLSLDLWRAFSERRALAGMADAAAIAGANGIDEQHWRASSAPELDPALAEQLAWAHLAAQTDGRALTGSAVAATRDHITVALQGEVDLTLVRVLMANQPLRIGVTASANPARSR